MTEWDNCLDHKFPECAILCTSHQIHDEAIAVFHEENYFARDIHSLLTMPLQQQHFLLAGVRNIHLNHWAVYKYSYPDKEDIAARLRFFVEKTVTLRRLWIHFFLPEDVLLILQPNSTFGQLLIGFKIEKQREFAAYFSFDCRLPIGDEEVRHVPPPWDVTMWHRYSMKPPGTDHEHTWVWSMQDMDDTKRWGYMEVSF